MKFRLIILIICIMSTHQGNNIHKIFDLYDIYDLSKNSNFTFINSLSNIWEEVKLSGVWEI